MSDQQRNEKVSQWKRQRVVIAESCEAYAARLRTVYRDGGTIPSVTIADLIITLERASAGLR